MILHTPSVVRFLAPEMPDRMRNIYHALHFEDRTKDVSEHQAGEKVADELIRYMQQTGMPNGLKEVGFCKQKHLTMLAETAFPQSRVIGNAPMDVSVKDLEKIYDGAWKYW